MLTEIPNNKNNFIIHGFLNFPFLNKKYTNRDKNTGKESHYYKVDVFQEYTKDIETNLKNILATKIYSVDGETHLKYSLTDVLNQTSFPLTRVSAKKLNIDTELSCIDEETEFFKFACKNPKDKPYVILDGKPVDLDTLDENHPLITKNKEFKTYIFANVHVAINHMSATIKVEDPVTKQVTMTPVKWVQVKLIGVTVNSNEANTTPYKQIPYVPPVSVESKIASMDAVHQALASYSKTA